MPENLVPGEKYIRNRLIVDKDKILLLPMHIKLGLMKNFVKATNKKGKDFEFLREKFPEVGDSKFKRASLLDRKYVKSLMTIYSIRTLVDENIEICMADITSDLSKFPC